MLLRRSRMSSTPLLLARVDLDHVDVVAAGDADAVVADAAGRGRRPFFAVEALGEDARGGGLADAAGAGEEIGVGDAVALEGVGEGAGGRLLADEVGEGLRPIAPGEDGVVFLAAVGVCLAMIAAR